MEWEEMKQKGVHKDVISFLKKKGTKNKNYEHIRPATWKKIRVILGVEE